MTEDTMTVKNAVRCENCRKYDIPSSTCRALPPSAVGWPATTPEEWCASFARAGGSVGKPPMMTNDQIVELFREDSRLEAAVDIIMRKGLGQSSAYARIRRLCMSGRLRRTKEAGVVLIEIAEGGEPKEEAEARAPGRPRLHEPAAIIAAIAVAAPDADHGLGYNALYRAIQRSVGALGKGTFAKILTDALATGAIAKADDGRYYAVPRRID